MEATEVAIGYHLATKHHYHQYARSLGYLDWHTQPNPFRRYAGAPLFLLPLGEGDSSPPYEALFRSGGVAPRPVTVETVSEFFENSLGLSAWKEYRESRWALRCNPSSGNLHPTEGYLVAGAVEGLLDRPAVYHYAPLEHGLERRTDFSLETWQELLASFPPGTFLAGLTSIHWREAWKYGERAYRYCQHDVGHALGAYCFAAAALGWRCIHLDGLGDAAISALLGTDRDADFLEGEREHPDLLIAVVPTQDPTTVPRTLPSEPIASIAAGLWRGQANVLSAEHVDWQIIDYTAEACSKPETPSFPHRPLADRPGEKGRTGPSARRIIQQRRSAVDMDGQTSISRDVFYRMLGRVTPGRSAMPWDTAGFAPRIHLGLFVHRVDGLGSGLYCLVRNPAAADPLRRAMRPGLLWEKPATCPAELPLYVLEYGDCRDLATQVSCHQEIAGNGAFSLGMLAEFESPLEELGPWMYRQLFWETGLVGQVLYLEAETASARATGMGCYFDDPVHQVFGIETLQFQSLYHFTVGGAVDDPRLTTWPPYAPERRALAAGWRGE